MLLFICTTDIIPLLTLEYVTIWINQPEKKCNIHRAAGRWFSPGTPVSSTNKTDRHDIAENIVESGVKHHKPSQKIFPFIVT